ncbi:lipoprotein [Chitinibacter sp. SCUT-21]
MRALIAFICSAFVLSACGFKGPLYLPNDQPVDSSKASAVTASAIQ